ncbi:MAG: hypothetical protein AAGH99_03735 [Planctomycetota bacterium]
MNFRVSACLLAVAALLWIGLAGSAAAEKPKKSPGYDSPEAAYAAARDAFNDRDWPAFVATVSPGRRAEIVGQMAVAMAGLASQPGSDPRIGELVEKHLPPDFDPMKLVMSEDAEAEIVGLAELIEDPEGFFTEAMSLIFSMQYQRKELAGANDPVDTEETDKDDTKQSLDAEIIGLEDLVIDGDTAEGAVTVETSAGNQTERWAFEKYKGRWYLSIR